MRIVHSQAELRGAVVEPCVFVPTMGALHPGHASLVREGAALAQSRGFRGGCVVSIFVNPTQFNEKSDYQRYPRTLDADADLCEAAGAACIFVPELDEVYPPDAKTPVPKLPRVASAPKLEDAMRPGHFAGVCQVVKRLFEMVRPTASIFGEKDWQQLQVVRAMVAQEGLSVDVLGRATIREPDGLAMSSRNRFLTPEDRRRGVALSRALERARRFDTPDAAETAMRAELAREGITPEYAVVRDAESLEAWTPGRPGRALIAARLGSVRLIDNGPWNP